MTKCNIWFWLDLGSKNKIQICKRQCWNMWRNFIMAWTLAHINIINVIATPDISLSRSVPARSHIIPVSASLLCPETRETAAAISCFSEVKGGSPLVAQGFGLCAWVGPLVRELWFRHKSQPENKKWKGFTSSSGLYPVLGSYISSHIYIYLSVWYRMLSPFYSGGNLRLKEFGAH